MNMIFYVIDNYDFCQLDPFPWRIKNQGQLPPREIAPATPKLTLSQNLTLTGGQFSSGAVVCLPPTLKLTLTLIQIPILTGGQLSG